MTISITLPNFLSNLKTQFLNLYSSKLKKSVYYPILSKHKVVSTKK